MFTHLWLSWWSIYPLYNHINLFLDFILISQKNLFLRKTLIFDFFRAWLFLDPARCRDEKNQEIFMKSMVCSCRGRYGVQGWPFFWWCDAHKFYLFLTTIQPSFLFPSQAINQHYIYTWKVMFHFPRFLKLITFK